jgi:hypothetical protein
MWRHGQQVEVLYQKRWWQTLVDAHEQTDAPYRWLLVAGIPGRAGPFAVHISDVRDHEKGGGT